jgi:hypothetical protein
MDTALARDTEFFYNSILLAEEMPRCYSYAVLLNRLALTSFRAFSGAKDNHSHQRRQFKQADDSRLCMFPARLTSSIGASRSRPLCRLMIE